MPWSVRAAALAGALALGVLALVGSARASPALIAVGSRPAAVANAAALGRVAPATPLRLTVVLRSRDPTGLAALAAAVATPGNPSFHHYLSVGEFASRFGAAPGGVASLRAALRADGLRPGALAPDGLSVRLEASAAQASRAFHVTLDRYRRSDGTLLYANTAAPLLPASLGGVVADVLGLSSGPPATPGIIRVAGSRPVRGSRRAAAHAASDGGAKACSAASSFQAQNSNFYTIDQIARAYRMDGLYADGDLGQGVTVALYELDPYASDGFEAGDTAVFQQCFGTHAQVVVEPLIDGGGTPTPSPGDGPPQPTAETAVDIQNLVGLAPDVNVEIYEGPDTFSGRYDTLSAIVSADSAQVISDSWGLCEQEDKLDAQLEANLLEEADIQDQTFVASTGDRGAEGCATEWNNNLTDLSEQLDANYPSGDPNAPMLAVDDPASQPYATAVGGTNLNSIGPPPSETAWDHLYWGASGGGISTLWAMPPYQLYSGAPGILNGYTSATPCTANVGTSSVYSYYCREIPDVAADGSTETGYVTYFEDSWSAFGGTSTSAPVWAALAALTDSALGGHSFASGCSAGPPIGFLNPMLYEIAAGDDHSSAFNDVTVGDNSGYFDGTVPFGSYPSGAYPATPGYDMVTGLGTPIASDGGSNGLVAQLCIASQTPTGTTPTVTGLGTTEASPGTPITIDGSGFTRFTAVYFGSVAASAVSYISPTQLLATVPPGSGTIDVTATGLAGWSMDSAADRFSYAPTATISSPASGAAFTQGQRVSAAYVCASSLGGTPTCSAPVASGAALDTSTLGTHQFTVTATDSNGVSTTATAVYTVLPPPAIAINQPAAGASYANGQVVAASYSCAASAPATLTSCTAAVAQGAPLDTTTPGAHTFTVVAADSNGVTTTVTTSYTVSAATSAPPPPLTLSALHQSTARWVERRVRGKHAPVGTTFSFTLDQSAQVTLSFIRLTGGRLAAGRCVAPKRAGRHARACTRTLPAGSLRLQGTAGANTVSFAGLTSSGRLAPGAYAVSASASSSSGQSAQPLTIHFTILAPKA
jgi:hypothetical protein